MNLWQKRQQGAVLVTSMIILLILTMLALSAVQNTSLQELMSRNERDSDLAFHSAETGLREAEVFLAPLLTLAGFQVANQNGLYDSVNNAPLNFAVFDWLVAANNARGFVLVVTVDVRTPLAGRYVIEHVRTVVAGTDILNIDNIGQDTGTGRTQMFRITSIGLGGSGTAQVTLQSTFGRQCC
ncbi:MAG: PilX N-terminal domain-containing pilus assembly protein [Pseudomonadota bacterium]|nr:PilX N-terminal domain-containing pilus assembly protein [Pseudomonadota bacterium]